MIAYAHRTQQVPEGKARKPIVVGLVLERTVVRAVPFLRGALVRLDGCRLEKNWCGPGGQGGRAITTQSAYASPREGGRGGSGGALYCVSDLIANQSTFDKNQAGAGGSGGGDLNDLPGGQRSPSGTNGGDGGAIFGSGKLVLYASTISGNRGGDGSSGGYGGYGANFSVVPSAAPESVEAQPKYIYWETDGGPGGTGGTGGIYSEGSLRMTLCTLSGNVGGAGGSGGDSSGGFMDEGTPGANGGAGGPGGIFSSSSNALALVACTLADNVGGAGGIGGRGAPYDLNSHTSTGQGAGGPGGVAGILKTNDAASAMVIGTIIAGNIGGIGGEGGPTIYSVPTNGAPDLNGSFTSLGYNLIGELDGSLGFTNGLNNDLAGSTNAPLDPVLGPLADNGGPTFTMALLHGSPALEAGDDALRQWPYALETDQRGLARKSGHHVDIGAFEFQFGNANGRTPQPIVLGTLLGHENPQANVASAVADAGAAAGFQLSFSNNAPGATFSVLATSDLSAPVEKWSVVGQAVQVGGGIFQFTDPDATNTPQRFYRVSAP